MPSAPILLARMAAAWAFAFLYWPAFAALHLLSLRRTPDSWLTGGVRLWGRATAAILGMRVVYETPYPFAERLPRVVITTHQSALDLVWGAMISPPAPLAIGKREVLYVPIVNLAWWALGFIRIDRKNPRKAIAALEGVARMIRRDARSLMLAPEGTRSPTGEVLPFKKGAFHLSMQSGAPIYPVVVRGAFELMPKSAFLARPGVVRLRFLPPETPPPSVSELDAWVEQVRSKMIAAFEEMGKEAGGEEARR